MKNFEIWYYGRSLHCAEIYQRGVKVKGSEMAAIALRSFQKAIDFAEGYQIEILSGRHAQFSYGFLYDIDNCLTVYGETGEIMLKDRICCYNSGRYNFILVLENMLYYIKRNPFRGSF